jgi:hypothetical protein
MLTKLLSFFILLYSCTFFSCKEIISPIPSIEYVSVSQTYLQQNGQDSVFLSFSFEDGDGNIGSDTFDNVFVSDSRTGLNIASFKIPAYLGLNPNNSKSSGVISIILFSPCCIYPDSSSCYVQPLFPNRNMQFKIRVVDNDGNYSNQIESELIVLDCTS